VDSGVSSTDRVTNNGAVSVGGLIPGATVEYSTDGGATWRTSFTAVEGNNTVQVRQVDSTGNSSLASSALSFTLDTLAPSRPTVISQVTSDTTPIIRGSYNAGDAAGGLSVTVSGVGTFTLASPELSATGNNWTLDLSAITPLAQGAYQVTATATDIAGNAASDSTTGELVIDTTPPPAPSVDTDITSSTTPSITGNATVGAGERLQVSVGGATYTEGDGHLSLVGDRWTLVVPASSPLSEGTYEVVARVIDAAGNASTDATTNELRIDTTAPTLLAQSWGYKENQLANAIVGKVNATDNSAVMGFGYRWADGSVRPMTEDGMFTIDDSGQVRMTAAGAASPVNDFEVGTNSRTYMVVATDRVGLTSQANVQLNVINVADTPPIPEPEPEPEPETPPGVDLPEVPPGGGDGGDRPGGGYVDGGSGTDDQALIDSSLAGLDKTIGDVQNTADELWNVIDDKVRLGISLEDQPILAEGITQLTLPSDTFVHDDPFARITVEATLADGSALPEFVIFDADSQTFQVDGEAALAAGYTDIDVQITGIDDRGESATGNFKIEVLGDEFAVVGEPAAGPGASADQAPLEDQDRPASEPGGTARAPDDGGPSTISSTDTVVRLAVTLDDQRVLSAGASTIALPVNTFEHSDPDRVVTVEATLEDGSPLPDYVDFDPESMTFQVDGQSAAAAGVEQIVILLVGKDDAGNSASGLFVISVEDIEEDAIGDLQRVASPQPVEGEPPENVPPDDAVETDETDAAAAAGEVEEGERAENDEEGREQQAEGRKNLDLQLEEASRYTLVDRIEQLMEDIKNLFT
jgi:hypothetical protein